MCVYLLDILLHKRVIARFPCQGGMGRIVETFHRAYKVVNEVPKFVTEYLHTYLACVPSFHSVCVLCCASSWHRK